MVEAIHLAGLLGLVFANTVLAALGTRFFRVRLHTRWGSAIYVVTVLPVVMVATTLVVGGVLSLGPDLGSPAAVLAVTIGLPMALGVSFDYFWMPSPEEVDLPQSSRRSRRPRSRRE